MEQFKNVEFKAQYKHSFNTSFTNKQGERTLSRGYVWEAIKPTALITEGIEEANGTHHKTDNTFVRWEFNPNRIDKFSFYVGKDENQSEILKIGRNMDEERFADDLEAHRLRKAAKAIGNIDNQSVINAFLAAKFDSNATHVTPATPATIKKPKENWTINFSSMEMIEENTGEIKPLEKEVKTCLRQLASMDMDAPSLLEEYDSDFIKDCSEEFAQSGKKLLTLRETQKILA